VPFSVLEGERDAPLGLRGHGQNVVAQGRDDTRGPRNVHEAATAVLPGARRADHWIIYTAACFLDVDQISVVRDRKMEDRRKRRNRRRENMVFSVSSVNSGAPFFDPERL
jgi:hypothetical protein